MTILFATTMPSNQWGGSEELWFSTALKAVAQGHVVVISCQFQNNLHSKYKELQLKGAIIVPFYNTIKQNVFIRIFQKLKRIKSPFSNEPHNYFTYLRELEKLNIDRILVSQGGTFDVIYNPQLLFVLKVLKGPYYLLSHFNNEHYNYPYHHLQLIRNVVLSAQKSFFISHKNLAVAKRQIAHKDFLNYEVIKNPCKLELDKPIEYPEIGNQIHFANIARLHCNTKGQDILIQVLSQEKWKNRNWKLHFYGDGEDKGYLKELVKFYNLSDKIIFEGYENDIIKIWETNHILVLSSIGEGCPLTIVEASMCGRPSIVTDVGDCALLVEHEQRGFVAKAPTYELFDLAFDNAWENIDKWAEFGKNAFSFAKSFVDAQAATSLLEKISL